MENKFLAKKYKHIESTPMGKVGELSTKYEDIINLSLGDPDFITNQEIIELAFEDAKNGHTHYTDYYGYKDLREEIVKYYNNNYKLKLDLSEVMIVVGGCHGMFLSLESIVDEGDEIIIHEPYFTPYVQQVKLVGGTPVILETFEEDGFQIDLDRLKSKITNKTRAVIINTPNNPTGACFSKEILKGICEIAKEKDILIISDEVYKTMSFEEPFIPISSFDGMKDRTITIGSFSKDYSMTGWRIGYIIAPPHITRCAKEVNEGVCFTAPSISQRAAYHALKLGDERQRENIDEYKKRIKYAYERINNIKNMSVMAPKGTFYLFVNVKKTGLSSIEVSERILKEARVLVIPGISFGNSGEGYIRIACTVGVDKLKEAFDRIEKIDLFL